MAKISGSDASPDLPANTYSVGKLILDPGDPSKVLYRSDRPLCSPVCLTNDLANTQQAPLLPKDWSILKRSGFILWHG
ncbi:MAG: hypothetical protein IPI77_10585 [Saprospiraceae bacterium]|nr:hypothetical protein [Saprospiraceae bacterium]